MQIHEQIYTSAAELLEGGGNLGVVAKTRGFPSELAPDLASLRSYTMLASLPIDQPDKHPPRFVGGPRLGGTLYSFSRIAFGGFDHTGRTTPLAHHLAAELSDMERDDVAPAELLALSEPMFVQRYTPPPRWIDPPRQIEATRRSDAATMLSKMLTLVPSALLGLIPRISNVVFAFAATRRPAIIVVDPGIYTAPLHLMSAVLSVLPGSVQRSTTWATHVVETTDYVRDAAIVFTYRGTPFLEQCQFRRDGRAPIIFGIDTAPSDNEAPSENTWAAIIGSDWPNNNGRVIEARQRWDQFGMKPADVEKFGRAVTLVEAIESAAPDQIAALGQKLSIAISPPAMSEWVADRAGRVIERWAGDTEALVAVACDPKWPQNARAAAIGTVLESAKTSSAPVSQLAKQVRPPGDLVKLIEAGIAQHPDVIPIVFSRAASTNDKEDIDAADFLLSAGPLDMFMALELAERVPSFSADRQRLSEILLKAISKSADSPQRFENLFNAGETDRDRQFSRSVTLPILRIRLKNLSEPLQWSIAYSNFTRISVQANDVEAQARWLFQTFRKNVSVEHVNEWLSDGHIGEAEKAVVCREAKNVGIEMTAQVDALEVVDDHRANASRMATGYATEHSGRSQNVVVAVASAPYVENDLGYIHGNASATRSMPLRVGGSTAGLIWWTNIVLAFIAIAGVLVGLLVVDMPRFSGQFPFVELERPPRKSLIAWATVGGILLSWILSGPLVGLTMRVSRKQQVAGWVPLAIPFVLLIAVAIAWWSIG